jgi:hypothetical protein
MAPDLLFHPVFHEAEAIDLSDDEEVGADCSDRIQRDKDKRASERAGCGDDVADDERCRDRGRVPNHVNSPPFSPLISLGDVSETTPPREPFFGEWLIEGFFNTIGGIRTLDALTRCPQRD